MLRGFQAAVADAGISRRLRLHDLRRAAASALLSEGVNMAVISGLLRHTRLATTIDVYSHLLEEGRGRAADVMDACFRRLLGQ